MEDQITIGVFDGSDLIHLGLFKNLMNGIKSRAQDGYAQVKRSKLTCAGSLCTLSSLVDVCSLV